MKIITIIMLIAFFLSLLGIIVFGSLGTDAGDDAMWICGATALISGIAALLVEEIEFS